MLVEKLKKDMVDAMKSKDKEKLTVIRMVKAALDKERIDKKVEVNDDLLIDVENKEQAEQIIKQTEKELNILKDYLPEQLSEDEVNTIIDDVITKVNASSIKDMGNVMKEVSPKVKGKADMRYVSEIIKSKLN